MNCMAWLESKKISPRMLLIISIFAMIFFGMKGLLIVGVLIGLALLYASSQGGPQGASSSSGGAVPTGNRLGGGGRGANIRGVEARAKRVLSTGPALSACERRSPRPL
eukprot:tig00000076_g2328.t1